MNISKKGSFTEQVRRFRARFVQTAGSAVGEVLKAQVLKAWVLAEKRRWRERLYSPLTTVVMFIEQVLGADHSCQDAVAQGLSSRVALGQAPCSLNTGPYCKAMWQLRVGRLICKQALIEEPDHGISSLQSFVGATEPTEHQTEKPCPASAS